jgi:hypothetical protein
VTNPPPWPSTYADISLSLPQLPFLQELTSIRELASLNILLPHSSLTLFPRHYRINIDPDKGPISSMTGGQPLIILSAGYLGSILIGSSLIMASFDTSASKVASLLVFPLFIICFWFGRTWARIRVLACIGLSVGFWFSESCISRWTACCY